MCQESLYDIGNGGVQSLSSAFRRPTCPPASRIQKRSSLCYN